MRETRPPYRIIRDGIPGSEQPFKPPVEFGDVPTGMGIGAFHAWPNEDEPSQIIHQQTTIRNWRIQGGPILKDWDPDRAAEHIAMVREAFPDVNFLIGLQDGADELGQVERWRSYCERLIELLGAQDYIFDAETMNPRFSPGGSWQAYVDIIEPVVRMVQEAGGRAWGPGNTGEKELGDLDNILRTMIERDVRFDVATVHTYPDVGESNYRGWLKNFESNWWSGFSRLARNQEKILRQHDYDFGAITEFGVKGSPWGGFEELYDAIQYGGPQQRVYEARQKRRYATLLDRARIGEDGSFWRVGYIYQITEGPEIGSLDDDWGLTTPRGEEPGKFRAKSVLDHFRSVV